MMDASNGLTDENTMDLTHNFSKTEKLILELYDQLELLRLECSFVEAQNTTDSSGQNDDVNEEILKTAQNELLDSQGLYSLRNNILESVLIANPVLKAVHAGPKASLVERDLRPQLEERDELSISLAALSSNLASTMEDMRKVESEHIILARKNVELTTSMLELAEEASTLNKEDVTDPDLRAEIDRLEEALRTSRQRWKIMKSTTSAVVAGSGVDWARDSALRELVLDNDGDDE